MTSFRTHIPGSHGEVDVLTKSRFLGVFKRPATSVIPSHGLGIQFRWTTDEPDTLEYVHLLVVQLMHEIPYADLRVVLNLHGNIDRKLARAGEKLGLEVPPAPLPGELQEILPYLKSII